MVRSKYIYLSKYSDIEADAKNKKKQPPDRVKRKILNINCSFKQTEETADRKDLRG